MHVHAIQPSFATGIGGVDLAMPANIALVDEIWRAIDTYSVLVFHDRNLTDLQLRDFAAQFGPLEIGRSPARGGKWRLALPENGDISSLDIDSNVRALDDRRRLDSLGNRLWHNNASYMPVPVVLGLLHAKALPPPSSFGNGETEFADMRAAHDALPDAMKAGIGGLTIEHGIFWSRGQIGFTEFGSGEREQYKPSPRRLVRTHPGSKRKTLYLSAHVSHFVGWPVADGRLLLLALNTHATEPRFVYSHRWSEGDLVIWDNRCTMHRGRPHDERQPRDLRRATTLDAGSTLDEPAAA
jgi:alpha-ketoglutarate-dependent 2,4-dichlorophenoxyacetate dioxygenase